MEPARNYISANRIARLCGWLLLPGLAGLLFAAAGAGTPEPGGAQGISGTVVKLRGDHMPTRGQPRGERTPLAAPVHIFKGQLKPMAAPDPKHPQFVTTVQADKEGRFRVELPPAEYTAVAELDGKLYLNKYRDAKAGGMVWGTITVAAGAWTEVTIEDSRSAVF